MYKKIMAAAAAALIMSASAVYAQSTELTKITHQNVHGSQSCYTDADCVETEITEIPDVVFGMRINKPVFRVYVKVTADTAGEVELKAEQYNAKGKLLHTDTQTVSAAAGENNYTMEFSHVRNAESIRIYADGGYIGGIDAPYEGLYLTEYPSDYEIYQRGADNTATVTFAGNTGAVPMRPEVMVSEDGTVSTQFAQDGASVYNAEYENGILKSVRKKDLVDGTAKFDSIALGSRIYVWDSEQTPLCNPVEVNSYYHNTQEVTVTINDEKYTAYSDFNGDFTLDVKLEPGIYNAAISNGGNTKEITQFGVGDIWVAAGQSNMTDMGAITDGFQPDTQDPVPENVHIIYPEDVTWQKMSHPAGEGRFFKTGVRTSPVTSFARKLSETLDIPIGIVQSSVGGTNIFQWAEGVAPNDENNGYLGNAMKACFDNKASKDITGIIWYQGCNDTMSENYAYNYEKLCDTIFGQFRDFFGADTPIITTQINDANQDSTAQLGYYDAWSYVKDVQRQYPDTHENVYVTGTGANDLGDTIHNNAASNLLVGGAWADMALNKVYGMTEVVCEHPTIDRAEVTGDNEITLTFKNIGKDGLYLRNDIKRLGITNGLVNIQLGDLKKEFVVRMGGDEKLTASNKGKGTENTVISAVLTDDNQVILTTADTLRGYIAVDCCYGKRFTPTLTDKATGRSVLAFYNVKAVYPDAIEPEAPVVYTAADTAYLREDDDTADTTRMFLNKYSGMRGNAAMKFDLSAQPIDKAHLQNASLNIYTTAIGKDRTGDITLSEIGTSWDNTTHYSAFSYAPLNSIKAFNTNTAGLFPVGNYSDIDITDFIRNAGNSFGIGISSNYASDCTMAGAGSENPPMITVNYGNIMTVTLKGADGNPAAGVKASVEGSRSTQYTKTDFITDENGQFTVILKSGDYVVTTETGAYQASENRLEVRGMDAAFNITLENNNQIPARVEITGGETEVRQSQTEKTLKPFTAVLYDEDGIEINGAEWTWSITPEIKATVTDGVVTTNAHAVAEDVLTLKAEASFNGSMAYATIDIIIIEAGDITYSFDSYQLAKVFNTDSASDVAIGSQGLTGSVSSVGNYTNIAVMSSADKSGTGYYPLGDSFSAPGYYLFLGAGGNNGTPTYVINLPEPAGSGKYLNIRYAKPTSTNGNDKNRTNESPDSPKTITVGSTVIDVQTDHEYDTWYTTSIRLDSGISSISVNLGKWAAIAIDHISVTSEPETTEIIIPEGSDAIKLLCLGDSITDGFTVKGAYRNTLCSLIEADGMKDAVDFIGTLSNGSGYDMDHEGHSGYAIAAVPASGDVEGKGRQGLTENIDTWMASSSPDIVLLQIGTNDILSLYELDNAKARLETLINKVENHLNENGKIYLATIPYISETATYNKTGKTQAELDAMVDSYNASVREIAESDAVITLADINGQLALSDLQDGIHPNSGGYAKMGTYWYSLLKDEFISRIQAMSE